MSGARRLAVQAAVIFSTGTGALAAGLTNWTGAGDDRLWENPANWSNGVPDADTGAYFTGSDGTNITVDLGGVTRHASGIGVGAGLGSLIRLTNGTLSTQFIDAISDLRIDTALTSDAAVLQLHGGTLFGFRLDVNGPIVGPMDVVAAGTFRGVNSYTGRTIVGESLEVDGGTILQSPVYVLGGARLTVAAPAGAPDGVAVADVTLNGSTLTAKGSSFDPPVHVGTLRLATGKSTVPFFRTVAANTLVRSPGATLYVGAGTLGVTGLRADVIPPLYGSGAGPDRLPVAPWGTGGTYGGRGFLTYDRGSNPGFRPLTTGEHAATFVTGGNVRLTRNTSLDSDASVNTLTLSDADLFLNGADLGLSGGGLLFDATASAGMAIRGNGTLTLPPGEGIVHAFQGTNPPPLTGARHTIDVPVAGGTLVKSGDAQLVLTRRNTYTGGTVIAQGVVEIGTDGALGTGPVRFSSGGIRVGYAGAVVNNDIIFGDGSSASGATGGFGLPSSSTTTLTGTLSGSGGAFVSPGALLGTDANLRLAGTGAAEGAYRLSITGGTLIIDGDYASPQAQFGNTGVGSAGIVGNGRLRGELRAAGATVSAGSVGDLPGRLTVGTANFFAATLHADLAGRDPGSTYDQLVVLDHLFLRSTDAALELAPAPGFTAAPGDDFTLIDNRFIGPVEGSFRNLGEGTVFTAAGTSWRITYAGGDGNDVVVTVVPEPSAIAGLAIGASLLLRRRRHAGS